MRRLEGVQRREPTACEEADAPADASPDSRPQQAARPRGLEAQELEQLGTRTVELAHAEAAPVLNRQIDAAELQVTRHVLEEVDELKPRADVVARREQLWLPVSAQEPEDEPPDRIGRMAAVFAQVVPRLVLGDALIHPVRLDQAQERLAGERELADRRLKHAEHGPGGLAGVAGVELALQLVERGEAVDLNFVPEDVDAAGEEQRRDGKVLRPRTAGNSGHLHP